MEDTMSNLENKSRDKGKAKVTQSTIDKDSLAADTSVNSSLSPDPGQNASVLARVKDSALAQGRNLLSHTDLASSGLASSKAGPASGTARQPASEESVRYTTSAATKPQGSLRSQNVQEHILREEANFSQFLEAAQVPDASGHGEGDGMGITASKLLHREHPRAQSLRGSHEVDNDGYEVVKLLDDDSYDEVMAMVPETALTIEQERSLRQALFGGDAGPTEDRGVPADWASLLNFVPEYISNGTSGWGYNELSQHLGTADVVEASQIWADQWGDVLSCYTDEVWGDLGLLVVEARKEARQVQERGREARPSEVKAIMRLRQILAQVRGN